MRTDLVMYYLLGEVINVLATITKVAKPIGSDWEVGVIPVYKKMVSLRKELNESAVMALDQNDPKAKGDQVGSD